VHTAQAMCFFSSEGNTLVVLHYIC